VGGMKVDTTGSWACRPTTARCCRRPALVVHHSHNQDLAERPALEFFFAWVLGINGLVSMSGAC